MSELNSKKCPLESCTQPHPEGEAWKAARKEWHAARGQRRKADAVRLAERVGEVDIGVKQHKDQRASLLCNWLVQHVGTDAMSGKACIGVCATIA